MNNNNEAGQKVSNNNKADYFRKGHLALKMWYEYLLVRDRVDVYGDAKISKTLDNVRLNVTILNQHCEKIKYHALSGGKDLTIEWLQENITDVDDCRRIRDVLGVRFEKAFAVGMIKLDTLLSIQHKPEETEEKEEAI